MEEIEKPVVLKYENSNCVTSSEISELKSLQLRICWFAFVGRQSKVNQKCSLTLAKGKQLGQDSEAVNYLVGFK